MNLNMDIIALCVFASYFLAILGLFFLITSDLRKLAATSNANTSVAKRATFVALTVASFAHTWFFMFKYMAWSFSDYGRALPRNSQDFVSQVASWLHDTSLFEQAWSLVCFNPLNWWWSEQLCLFTAGAWTAFLAIEGRRLQIKHLWAYMLLGQIVAISVASNLFYLAILLSTPPKDQKSKSIPPSVSLCIFASLATVAATPYTSKQSFLPNLLTMHALLFIPLLYSQDSTSEKKPRFSMEIRTLYNLIYIISALIHIKTTLTTELSLDPSNSASPLRVAEIAWKILYSNPAQSSIGWDVIWTSVSFAIWIVSRPTSPGQTTKSLSIPYMLFATPLISVGVTAPYVLQPRTDDSVSESTAPLERKNE